MNAAQVPNALGALRRFVRQNRPLERCELCGAALAPDHAHLMELRPRKLICACDSCGILFSLEGATGFKRIPRRIRFLEGFCMTDAQWESLLIPINVAFFFESSPEKRIVAMYPSPAGAPESQLPLETWGEIAEANPLLAEMEADVEALLVNRLGQPHGYPAPEYYLLPIDECYRLVGLIREHWRGLSGGAEVWAELANFFAGLKARAAGDCHA